MCKKTANGTEMNVYQNTFYTMESRFNALFPFEDDDLCEKLFHSIEKEVRRIETKLSYFDEKSVVSYINRNAFKTAVKVDNEMFEVIKTSLIYLEKTFYAFDITMRKKTESIIFDKKVNNVKREIKSHLNEIELNKEKSIHYKSDKIKIDFGGFGKGYALERIKPLLDNSPM